MRGKLIAACLISLLGTIVCFAGDNSLGTWKLNVEKSEYTPAPLPVKSLTSTREASDGGVKVTTKGERADGTPTDSSYTAKYDGKDNPVTGGPYDTIAIKQVDDNTFTFTARKSTGKYQTSGRMVISKDGKTMTSTFKGTNGEGKEFSVRFVWEKQ